MSEMDRTWKPVTGYEPRTREGGENRDKILKALSVERLAFGELAEETNLPRGTLARHLKNLLKHREILKVYDYDKEKSVYSVVEETLTRKMILPDFVNWVGTRAVKQLLELEIGIISKIDSTSEIFGYGSIELFYEERYKRKPIDYKEILKILKEEYGPWIEVEEDEHTPW